MFFGSILAFGEPDDAGEVREDEHGHRYRAGDEPAHAHNHAPLQGEGQAAGWGDCCGIPIPSAFAAAEQAEGARSSAAVRRIPFD